MSVSTGHVDGVQDIADGIEAGGFWCPIRRELRIIEPISDRRFSPGEAVMLIGEATTRLSGQAETLTAWWSSNRDGFLVDGLRARVSGLSLGRHVIRLTLAGEAGEEKFSSVVVWVHAPAGDETAQDRPLAKSC